ncbi:hypothetical protein OG762_13985 [Streptomyces sp. NBC_01136]|nr:hypothetical protein OG762_13985 [Streptomyces sp. NBC_01136]
MRTPAHSPHVAKPARRAAVPLVRTPHSPQAAELARRAAVPLVRTPHSP